MRAEWDERAERDARAYVEATDHAADLDAFFAAGERRVSRTVDPALETWDRDDAARDSADRLVALDVGCGIGRTTRPLADRFHRAVGVDVSPEMVRRAERANDDREDLSFHATDGVSLAPIGTAAIDFAFSYEVLQHVPSCDVIAANVREIARVLAPGGRCCLHFQPPTGPASPLVPAKRRARRALRTARELLPVDASDDLTRSVTWAGTEIGAPEFWRLLDDAGLELAAFHPDPTHGVGERLFAIADQEG